MLSDVDAAALAYGQGVLSGDEDDGESDEELEMPDDPSSSSDSGEEPDADQGVDDEALMGVDLDGIVAMATAASVAHPPVAVRPPPKRVSTADAEFQAKSLYFLHFDCEHTGTHVCQLSGVVYAQDTLRQVGEPFNSYVKPPVHRWNESATAVHGLSVAHARIATAEPLSVVWPLFCSWWERTIGVGTAAASANRKGVLTAWGGKACDAEHFFRITETDYPDEAWAVAPRQLPFFWDPIASAQYKGTTTHRNPLHEEQTGLPGYGLEPLWCHMQNKDRMVIDGRPAHDSLCDAIGQAQITMTAEFLPFANKAKGIVLLEDVYKSKRERRRKQGRETVRPVPRGWTEHTARNGPAWKTPAAMDYDGGVNNGPKHGPKGAARTVAEFIQLFYLFIPISLLAQIADETNLYAVGQWVKQVIYGDRKKPTYIPCGRADPQRVRRFRRMRSKGATKQPVEWTDVTANSLLVYFGILIAMGAMRTRNPDHLWANESKGGKGYGVQVAWIRNSMTQQAFHDHRRFLHFEDTSKMARSTDPLKKIRRFVTHLNKAFGANWTLGQYIVVDEAMIACKSRYCNFIQYMPAKPIKHGIKEFVLCCAYTSYVMSFEVFTGASEQQDGSPTAVIERLLAGCDVHGSGHGHAAELAKGSNCVREASAYRGSLARSGGPEP